MAILASILICLIIIIVAGLVWKVWDLLEPHTSATMLAQVTGLAFFTLVNVSLVAFLIFIFTK